MDYLELLQNPFWQRKSSEIKMRDNWTCRRCSDKLTNLQVHHLYYKYGALPWEYPDEALITLCVLCHKKAEFVKWFYKHAVPKLYELGLTASDIDEVSEMMIRRVESNMHRQSAEKYMTDLKWLING